MIRFIPPCPGDIVIDTDNKSIREVIEEMKIQIDAVTERIRWQEKQTVINTITGIWWLED